MNTMSVLNKLDGELTGEYLSLLLAVQGNPFGTVEELARKTGTSRPTATKRLDVLHKKRIFIVKPLLNNFNLGFEQVDVLLETNDLNGTRRLEQIGIAHPYTSYNVRIYGRINGIFCQFRTPMGTKPLIQELVNHLRDAGIINRFEFMPTGGGLYAYTSMHIEGWDPDTFSWKFNWDEWFDRDTELMPFIKMSGTPGEAIPWLTKNDLYIISELMRGARRKNVEILNALKRKNVTITPQTFSRRYQMIREECLSGFRVTFDSRVFDIHNSILIIGKGDQEYLHSLCSRLNKYPVPFESAMRVIDEHLFWSIRLQSSHLSKLISNLYSRLKQMDMFVLDYNHSHLYYLWPETLDENSHQWRTDREFMIDNVLNKIR
jgi:DNA-binding Lrp family transcriptional regulator